MRKTVICITAVLFVTFIADAATIYAPNGLSRPYPFSGPDDLVMFDSSDPAGFVTIGSMNVQNIGFGGLDFDRDGNLWAYASYYKSTGGAAAGLYSVNTSTGQATPQGTNSQQPLDDLAFNPTNDTMYGIRAQGDNIGLYSVNLVTGGTALVGNFTGGPASPISALGLAIDSQGNFYVHETVNDKIFKSGAGLALTELYLLSQDTYASQGMTIDWSRGDQGYHGAVGKGDYPEYFAQLNYFSTDGSSYVLGPDFGANEHYPNDPFGYPLVEPTDLAIAPIPEPASLLLIVACALLRRR